MMGASCSSERFSEFEFNASDEVADPWKLSTKSKMNKSRFDDSPLDKYKFLEFFAGGTLTKKKKFRNEPSIVCEVDEAVKERISRSDAAAQSSSSKYNSEMWNSYRGGKIDTLKLLKAATDIKKIDSTLDLHLAEKEPVCINSDEDNDDASPIINAGSFGKQMQHDSTSREMKSSVVVSPKYVTYGRNQYRKVQFTFFSSSMKLDVSEVAGSMASLTYEWKTADLVNIESQWCEPFETANVCLYIKSEHPEVAESGQKPGILEVKFAVCDPHWDHTQELIKSLDARYEEKWDVDLDSYESFEDIAYLDGDCDSISISKRDIQLLQPEKFINDTIVDFYIEYLKKKIKPADQRVHFFNSFFFRKLAGLDDQLGSFDSEAAFQRVRKWTKKYNLFQKDYIFIPINFSLHWSLIVICHPGEVVNFRDEELEKSLKVPCILHMDSIEGSHRGLKKLIRCYLWEEWKERTSNASEDTFTKFMNLRFLCLELPQQQNSYDCGLFMLHYMELFVKQAPINFNPLSTFLRKDWFSPTEASLKRSHIKRLILELARSNSQKVEKCSELKDVNEKEADVEILHETYHSKEIDQDSQFDSEGFPDSGDNRRSMISENDQNHGQLVLYDPSSNALSSIKECEEREDILGLQLALTGPSWANTNAIKKPSSVNSLKSNDNYPSEELSKSSSQKNDFDKCSSSSSDEIDIPNAYIVEDSDECSSSSSDEVFETCVVKDSDSEDSSKPSVRVREKSLFASSADPKARKALEVKCSKPELILEVEGCKRRRIAVSETQKIVKRRSSEDLQEIFSCE